MLVLKLAREVRTTICLETAIEKIAIMRFFFGICFVCFCTNLHSTPVNDMCNPYEMKEYCKQNIYCTILKSSF